MVVSAMDRRGGPADRVPLSLFPASDASASVTGSYYVVDGEEMFAPTPW